MCTVGLLHWSPWVKQMQDLDENYTYRYMYINGLVQDCSNSSAWAMELRQSCTKPTILSRFAKQAAHAVL